MALLLLLPLSLSGCKEKGTRPFADLKAEDLVSAEISRTPPGETTTVTDSAVLADLADLLADLVIYEKDDSAGEYDGQLVDFTLTYADGATRKAGAYGSFLYLDDVSYRTELEPCSALGSFGNLVADGEYRPSGGGNSEIGSNDAGAAEKPADDSDSNVKDNPGSQAGKSPEGESTFPTGTQEDYFSAPDTVIMTAKIMEVNDSYLLIIKTGPDARSSDLITVGIQNIPVFLEDGSLVSFAGGSADFKDGSDGGEMGSGGSTGYSVATDVLQAGDLLEIAFDGSIMESYPAQISASALRVTGSEGSLVSFYLDVLTEWYEEDPALNDGITQIGFDLTKVGSLTEAEKSALIYLMSARCGKEPVTGTFEELCENGQIDREKPYWEDGVLFTLSEAPEDVTGDDSDIAGTPDGTTSFFFSVQKWRGGLGAIGSSNCRAEWKDGSWHYTAGEIWIS